MTRREELKLGERGQLRQQFQPISIESERCEGGELPQTIGNLRQLVVGEVKRSVEGGRQDNSGVGGWLGKEGHTLKTA